MQRLFLDLEWTDEREAHIRKHGVNPAEVEEVLSGEVLVISCGRDRFRAYGRTVGGRYLLVVFEDGDDTFCVTARPMKNAEKRYYQRGGK